MYKNKGTRCPDTDLISYKREIGSPYCMAQTKQTAQKTSGGKPLVMGRGRGKGNLKSDPKPGGRLDRKVVIEYSSDESLDAPKRVKKQIHLTLPTSPAHVMTTETFATFFINHGLMKALCKAFEKRGWSMDQMQELITNFQRKHGKKVPLPKLYMDEDSSDSEGLELADGTRVGRKATDGAGGSGRGKPGRKPAAGSSSSGAGGSVVVMAATLDQVQEVVELVVLAVLTVAQEEAPSVVEMTMTQTTIPTRGGRPVTLPNQQGHRWLGRNLGKATLVWQTIHWNRGEAKSCLLPY